MANSSGFDAARLKSYLSDELGTEIVETEILGDGMNLVLALSTEREENAYLLRRPNRFKQSTLVSGLRQEYRLLQRLEETSVPTPTPVLFCEDTSVIGDQFYVRTYLDGIPMSWGAELPEQYQNAAARQAIADSMIETLGQIQSLDSTPFRDLCATVSPVERVQRGIDRLDEATTITGRETPRLRKVADWLLANAPSDTTTALVHGDYRPGNMLLTETGPPRVAGVLDWEAAIIGDPRIDLGWFLLVWRDSGDLTPSVTEIQKAYPDSDIPAFLEEVNKRGFLPFTSEPGSPTRQEIVAEYERQTSTSVENLRFYRALAAFTAATHWEFTHGQNVEAADDATLQTDFAPLADYMTSIADSIVDGRFDL